MSDTNDSCSPIMVDNDGEFAIPIILDDDDISQIRRFINNVEPNENFYLFFYINPANTGEICFRLNTVNIVDRNYKKLDGVTYIEVIEALRAIKDM